MSLISPLDWDSRHFSLRIGRIDSSHISLAEVEAIRSEVANYDCVYLLADPENPETALYAGLLGFQFADTRVTLEVRPTTSKPYNLDFPIRLATKTDTARLEDITESAYTSSRFYFDLRFPRDQVEEMYKIWIRECVETNAYEVIVIGETANGYITYRTRPDSVGEIGLVTVHKSVRNKNYGKCLLSATLQRFWDLGLQRASVVTQGRNLKALRLYESAGFRVESQSIWYHRWAP